MSDQALHSFSEAKQFCSELGELKFVDFLWLDNLIIGIILKEIVWNNDYIFVNIFKALTIYNSIII